MPQCTSLVFVLSQLCHSLIPTTGFERKFTGSDSYHPQVELEHQVENIGAKLVRLAASRTYGIAGDSTTGGGTTASVLSAALIVEGMQNLP